MHTFTIPALLLIAFAFNFHPSAPDSVCAAEINYNLIDFRVQSRREVSNDLMTAVMFTEQAGSEPAELAKEVNRRLAAAVAQTKDVQGITVESGTYRSSANYQKGKQLGWRVRAELRLESRDFAALAKLIGRLQADYLQLGSMQFSISRDLRSRTENDLTQEVLAAFQHRADQIRQALKAQGLRIVTIRLDAKNAQPPRPMFRAKTMSVLDDSNPPAAEAGTSEIVVIADGTVQLQP